MKTVQQEETLKFFRQFADNWKMKADGSVPNSVNVIKMRNNYVLEVAKAMSRIKNSLDVGCGTGDLVCAFAQTGIKAVGVDFSEDMIELSRKKVQEENILDSECRFVHASIFEYDPEGVKYDLISANGFIEYISKKELLEFIKLAKSMLAPKGSLVIGSRNRLYNAFSLNDYTQQEIKIGSHDKLIKESMIIANAENITDCIRTLASEKDDCTAFEHHPDTGIKVSTRHQYTPGQLIRLFQEQGLRCIDIFPVHYQCLLPRFARNNPEIKVVIANLIQDYAFESKHLVPFASTFMLRAELD